MTDDSRVDPPLVLQYESRRSPGAADAAWLRWAATFLVVWGATETLARAAEAFGWWGDWRESIEFHRGIERAAHARAAFAGECAGGAAALLLGAGATAGLTGWRRGCRLLRMAAWMCLPVGAAQGTLTAWSRLHPAYGSGLDIGLGREVVWIGSAVLGAILLPLPLLVLASVRGRDATPLRRPDAIARRIVLLALVLAAAGAVLGLVYFRSYLRQWAYYLDATNVRFFGRVRMWAGLTGAYLGLPLTCLTCAGATMTLLRVRHGAAVLRAVTWCGLAIAVPLGGISISYAFVDPMDMRHIIPWLFAGRLLELVGGVVHGLALPLAILWFVRRDSQRITG